MGKTIFKASETPDSKELETKDVAEKETLPVIDETSLPTESEVRTRMKELFNFKNYRVEKRDYDKEPLNAKEVKSLCLKHAAISLIMMFLAILATLICITNYVNGSYSKDAQNGSIPNGDLVAVQEALDQTTADGMFNIGINTKIYFATATSNGIAGIENPESSIYNMSVGIYLDDTKECVYQSGAIKPGQYINSIALDNNELAADDYSATAVFNALDVRTNDVLGSVSVKIALIVEG